MEVLHQHGVQYNRGKKGGQQSDFIQKEGHCKSGHESPSVGAIVSSNSEHIMNASIKFASVSFRHDVHELKPVERFAFSPLGKTACCEQV